MRNCRGGAVLFSIFLLGLSLGLRRATAHQKTVEPRPSRGTLYLTGAYQFAKIDWQAGAAKTWPLLALAGLEDAPECSARHALPSCDWHASETRLDLKGGRMYFLTPAASPGDESEAGAAETESSRFVVWVVGLRDLKPIKKIEVPFAQQNVPTILLALDGKTLLVSYGGKDGKTHDVDTIDTVSFAKISTAKDSSGDVLNTYFPTEAYFAPSAKFIIRGDHRIWMEPGAVRADYVDPRAKFPVAEQKKLSGFLKVQPDGRKLLIAAPGASVNGVTLEMVVNEGSTESAFWTIDVESGATSPAVAPKYFAKGELIGQGQEMVLLEGSMMPPTKEEGYRFERTGRVAIYNVKSGAMAREFQMPELKGVGELLCSSADGTLAAYGHGQEELMILDLKAGHVTRVPGTFDRLPQPRYTGACEFGE